MFKFIKYFLYIFFISIVLFSLYYFSDYYLMEYGLRPRHTDYKILKPGGLISHGYGIVGSLMMILLLFYSMRKRTRIFGKIGAISRWLDIHIFFGTVGPLLVILHSTFKLNGIVSVSFWSMVLVALSGFVGRYLYVQIPRTIRGNEMTLGEVEKVNGELGEQLQTLYKMQTHEIKNLELAIAGSLKGGLAGMVFADLFRAFRIRGIEKQLRRLKGIPKNKTKPFIKILTQKALLNRRIIRWEKVHKLFHFWHVFHKPFAIIMYIIMIVHVGISVWLGYTWIF
ncbi:MAG: hypothetical protein KDF60_08130 [Calditrichaeota bacterium]|nr:hypothetical protein [Calditrichota bacterium]